MVAKLLTSLFSRKQDLLLVQLPNLREPAYLVGIASLKAYLKAEGHRVKCFNPLRPLLSANPNIRTKEFERYYSNEMEEKDFVPLNEEFYRPAVNALFEEISRTRPRFVGFSMIYGNVRTTLHFAEQVKQRYPNLPLLFGGPGVKTRRAAIRDSFLNAMVVYGDGEETVDEILRHSRSYADDNWKNSVLGLEFWQNGEWRRNGDRPSPKNLENYPQPFYKDFRKDPYAKEMLKSQPLSLGRGCPFRCRFCAVRNYGSNFRHYSIRSCVNFVRLEEAKGNRFFFVHDPITNGNPGWLRDFCRALIKAKVRISWGGNVRLAKYLNETETLDLLFQSGFKKMIIGLESAAPRVLTHMRKYHDTQITDQIFEKLRVAKKKYDLQVHLQLIVGYPNETEEDFQMTLDFVTKHRDVIHEIISCSSFLMIQSENDDLQEMTEKGEFGLVVRSEADWTSDFSTPEIRHRRMQRAEAHFKALGIPYRMFYGEFLEELSQASAQASPEEAFALLEPEHFQTSALSPVR